VLLAVDPSAIRTLFVFSAPAEGERRFGPARAPEGPGSEFVWFEPETTGKVAKVGCTFAGHIEIMEDEAAQR
jgi:hypothetical protein